MTGAALPPSPLRRPPRTQNPGERPRPQARLFIALWPTPAVRTRLAAWRETPVTTLVLGTPQPEALQTLAELVL